MELPDSFIKNAIKVFKGTGYNPSKTFYLLNKTYFEDKVPEKKAKKIVFSTLREQYNVLIDDNGEVIDVAEQEERPFNKVLQEIKGNGKKMAKKDKLVADDRDEEFVEGDEPDYELSNLDIDDDDIDKFMELGYTNIKELAKGDKDKKDLMEVEEGYEESCLEEVGLNEKKFDHAVKEAKDYLKKTKGSKPKSKSTKNKEEEYVEEDDPQYSLSKLDLDEEVIDKIMELGYTNIKELAEGEADPEDIEEIGLTEEDFDYAIEEAQNHLKKKSTPKKKREKDKKPVTEKEEQKAKTKQKEPTNQPKQEEKEPEEEIDSELTELGISTEEIKNLQNMGINTIRALSVFDLSKGKILEENNISNRQMNQNINKAIDYYRKIEREQIKSLDKHKNQEQRKTTPTYRKKAEAEVNIEETNAGIVEVNNQQSLGRDLQNLIGSVKNKELRMNERLPEQPNIPQTNAKRQQRRIPIETPPQQRKTKPQPKPQPKSRYENIINKSDIPDRNRMTKIMNKITATDIPQIIRYFKEKK
jgi:hypothetical protein